MPDHRESLVLAGITIVLISIPATPQTVEISEGVDMEGRIDSNFSDRFKADFSPGKVVNSMMDSESKLQINRSFEIDKKTEDCRRLRQSCRNKHFPV